MELWHGVLREHRRCLARYLGKESRMNDLNINPYYDQAPIIDVSSSVVGDSGMPGWMPVGAFFFGVGLFAIVAVGAFTLTGTETPPTQAPQQAATQPAKTNAQQPGATAAAAQQPTQQQQQALQPQPQTSPPSAQQAAPAQPQNAQNANVPSTTGSAPKQ
jgi:hypothetical protein